MSLSLGGRRAQSRVSVACFESPACTGERRRRRDAKSIPLDAGSEAGVSLPKRCEKQGSRNQRRLSKVPRPLLSRG